jgi:FkbM family methyltransferase
MNIGFVAGGLTLRGTDINLYNYAHYNEKILGNKSIIICMPYDYHKKHFKNEDVVLESYTKFSSRFDIEYYYSPSDIEDIVKKNNIDVLFIEKFGLKNDGLVFNYCKTIIHAVFSTAEPHGDLYCPISDTVNKLHKTNFPVLPNMVDVYDTNEDLRDELNIPKDAIVFGSYSGAGEYNIDFIKQAVSDIAVNTKYSNIYFIYLNILKFGPDSSRLKFLPGTADMYYKRKFINTCNAMLYGRKNGETFGLACAEFSVCNKPIIGCTGCHDDAHEQILGDNLIKISNYNDVFEVITNWSKYDKDVSNNKYKEFNPYNVIHQFQAYLLKLYNPSFEIIKNNLNEKYLIYPDDYIGDCIKKYGRFSPTEITFLEKYIKDDDNIIEGGANIGSHTIPLAKLNTRGKVFCFEPQVDIYTTLKLNITLNKCKNVVSYRYALGNSNDIIRYNMSTAINKNNRGGFSIPSNNSLGANSYLIIKSITDFTDIYSLNHIKLIKLDIEGYEPIVLKTMTDLIMKHRPILFIEYNNKTFFEIVSIIKPLNYTLFYFNTLVSQYNQFAGKQDNTVQQCDVNIVCFPNDKEFDIPTYLIKVENENYPRLDCFVSYNDVTNNKPLYNSIF